MFLATGHNGLRIVSKDGQTWGKADLGKEGQVYRAAAFGNGRFAAVGTFGGMCIMASSADGGKWETGTRDAKYKNYFRGVAFGDGRFIAIGGDAVTVGRGDPFLCTSKDGVTWDENSSIGGNKLLRRISYGNKLWVGVGDRGRVSSSADGVKWSDSGDTKATDTLIDVTFGNGVFVGVGLHGLRRSTADGAKWSEAVRGEEGEHLNSVLFTGKQFVAISAGATYFSPDGKTWKRVPNKNAPTFATFGGGVFVGTSWRGRLLRSADGVEWKDVHKCEHPVEAIAFGA